MRRIAWDGWRVFVLLWLGLSLLFWWRILHTRRTARGPAESPSVAPAELEQALEARCRDRDPSTPPLPVLRKEPIYPIDARRRGIEGWVVVEYRLREDGTIGEVRVVQSSPVGEFERVAEAAVRTWRFCPVRERVSRMVRLDFKLDPPQPGKGLLTP